MKQRTEKAIEKIKPKWVLRKKSTKLANNEKKRRLNVLKSDLKEGRNITTNLREIKRITRAYYNQLYTRN